MDEWWKVEESGLIECQMFRYNFFEIFFIEYYFFRLKKKSAYFYRGGSKMWKDSIRNIVVIFQTTILRIIGLYVRRSAYDYARSKSLQILQPLESY
jgi:hypothetical protein